MGKKSVLYEKYHEQTKTIGKIIEKNNFTYFNILVFLAKHLRPGMRILDVGCGAGTVDLYLAKIGHKVVGIDISNQAVRAAKNSAKELRVYKVGFYKKNVEIENLNLGRFDLIICSEILEHLKNYHEVFRKLLGSLKQGGLVMITVPSKNAPLYRWGLTKKFDRRVGHLRRFDLQMLEKISQDNDLKILEIKKTESLFRNALFVFSGWGLIIKLIRGHLVPVFHFFDAIFVRLLGESQILTMMKK